eukprot:847412-Prymnesium_polylepis.1
MTDTPDVSRGADKDAQWLSDRATKRGLLARIAGLKTKGHCRTFNSGAAGVKMTTWSSGANGA